MNHDIFRNFRYKSSGTLGVPDNSNPIESHHQFLTSKHGQSGPLQLRGTRVRLFYQGYPQLVRAGAAKATTLIAEDAVKAGCHVLANGRRRQAWPHCPPRTARGEAVSFTNADLLSSCEEKAWYRNSSAHMGKVTSRCSRSSTSTSVPSPEAPRRASSNTTGRALPSLQLLRDSQTLSHNLHKVRWASENDRFECDCEGYWTWVLCAHVLAIQHIHCAWWVDLG